jgi:hypothetical protein
MSGTVLSEGNYKRFDRHILHFWYMPLVSFSNVNRDTS